MSIRRSGAPSDRKRSRIAGQLQLAVFARWFTVAVFNAFGSVAGFALGYAALCLCVIGVFRDPYQTSTPQLLALAGLCLLLLARLSERLRHGGVTGAHRAHWADLELGTLFVAAAFAVIEIAGGPSGLLYPLIYALVAFLVAFNGVGKSLYFLVLMLGAEAAIVVCQPSPDSWRLYASHASFILLFALLCALFLRTEVAQHRRDMQCAIDDRMQAISDEASDFRLTSGLSLESRDLTATELQSRRQISSLQAIHDSLYNVLAVAERALTPHTVALLWMDADEKHVRLKELRSQSDRIHEGPIAAAEGFVGAITKRREPLLLERLKAAHPGLVYYDRGESVTDFAGVPVMEGEHLRGVLVADRKGNRPFDPRDLEVMGTIADEIVRAVQVERIFAEMDREKYQKERFYHASRDFNSALTVEQVAEVAISAARRVAAVEFAAVAVATEREAILKVAAVDWKDHDEANTWIGREFRADEGLVGAAIKSCHPLPHGTAHSPTQKVFCEDITVDLPGVKVVPLMWKGQGVGALALGSERKSFLAFDLLDMIRVIADHAAIAIANAQMYERMERMATTDGLTGLVNHRHFQELFSDSLARSHRYSRSLSIVLTDIDHFKTINDTYGHPVGDRVLRRIADILSATARRTDIVARYGGEEFAVVMEETDREGAIHTGERIRQAVEAESFHAENGAFKCTLSSGIATFPMDGRQQASLIECADQALYRAKHAGRNQTVSYDSLRVWREVS